MASSPTRATSEPPACPHCGSSRFHLLSGITYCANGHDQHRGPLTAVAAPAAKDGDGETGGDGDGAVVVDDADWNRRGGKMHRVKGEKRVRVRRTARGREAAELWVRGMGWVVWRESWAVARLVAGEDIGKEETKRVEDVGGELWGLVKGMWALRVSQLMARWDAEQADLPPEDTDATETEVSSDGGEDREETKAEERKRHTFLRHAPKLVDTVVLQYLALLLMRHPVSLSTIHEWVQTEALPYVRAIRDLPSEIKVRLPPEYHLSFDTTNILRREELQLAVHRNIKHFASDFSMTFPPMNWRPILLRWVQHLALPLQVYAMVKQLNDICAFDFTYNITSGTRRSAIGFPDAQLMALLVVSTKLLFPFDAGSVRRFPRATTEQGLIRIDWQNWLAAKEWFDTAVDQEKEARLTRGKEMEIRDVDIMRLDEQGLDEYMDWYQRMWVSDRVAQEAEGVQKELLAMFPVKELQERDEIAETKRVAAIEKELRDQRLSMVLGGLKSRQVVTDKQLEEYEAQSGSVVPDILRPGMGYQVFQSVDSLDGVAKVFHEEAADMACLDLKGLLRAINLVESRVDKWRRGQKREAFFGAEDMDIPAESVEVVQ